jgi:hypothetical protein
MQKIAQGMFSTPSRTRGVYFSACTRAEKLTPHLHFLRDLRVLLFKLFS